MSWYWWLLIAVLLFFWLREAVPRTIRAFRGTRRD